MCYNDLYKVSIRSVGDGWTEDKSAEGSLKEIGGGICLEYLLDGDECRLTVKGGKVVQERKGAQEISLSFEEGKVTACTIGSGGFSGSFEIFTEKLKFVSGKYGFQLYLGYISGSDREKIQLTLTAVKNSWGTK